MNLGEVEGFLLEMAERQRRIEQKVDRLLPEYYTVKDICERLGVSRKTVSRCPWLMCNFGVSDLPGKTKRWTPANWERWWAASVEEHRREWESMAPSLRAKYKGVA